MASNYPMQDAFLTELAKEKIPVSVFLVNGIKLHGAIDSFDASAVMLKNAVTQMVFKHAISTIVPGRGLQKGSSETHGNVAD